MAQLQQQAVALQNEIVQRQLAEETLRRMQKELQEAREQLYKTQQEATQGEAAGHGGDVRSRQLCFYLTRPR